MRKTKKEQVAEAEAKLRSKTWSLVVDKFVDGRRVERETTYNLDLFEATDQAAAVREQYVSEGYLPSTHTLRHPDPERREIIMVYFSSGEERISE